MMHPTLSEIGTLTVVEEESITINPPVSDGDGDDLTFSLSPLPLPFGLEFDPDSGSIQWTPTLFQSGVHPLRMTATDGHSAVSRDFAIDVVNKNQAPILVRVHPQYTIEGQKLDFFLLTDDADGDDLTLAATSQLPPSSRFNPETGRFQWTPGFGEAGDYVVSFSVTDPSGLSDSIDVEIHVDDVNIAPTISESDHQIRLGEELRFTVDVSDPDAGASFDYSATDLPSRCDF